MTRLLLALLALTGCATTTPAATVTATATVRTTATATATVTVQARAARAADRPDTVWDRLAACESSGDWHINTGNGFAGGLQFTQTSWEWVGGLAFAPRADLATKAQQITAAKRLLARQGWERAWPACSRLLGLTGGTK